LILIPIPTVVGAIVWGFCAKVLKVSSISSLLGLIGVVISAIMLNNGLGVDSNAPMYFITFIIFYKHIPNIIRLFQGSETKVA
jgi:glycerol-3-phosphate acyltransferase PlsY